MTEFDSQTLILFDVDGTLTLPRASISAEMDNFVQELRKRYTIGLVGGSDLAKIAEQTCTDPGADKKHQIEQLLLKYDYVFAENGLVAYHKGKLIGQQSIVSKIGEDKLQQVINFCLNYLSQIVLPVKRGNFIEFRTGMINISPIGRSCSQSERLDFLAYDLKHKIRETMAETLKIQFGHLGLTFAIGGQISIDCFPTGWDKTFCLQFVENKFDRILFYGDKTSPGGNDHEIYTDRRVDGFSVKDPKDTMTQIDLWTRKL